jgi:hypothetical protein
MPMNRIRNAVVLFVAGLGVLGSLALPGLLPQAAAQGSGSGMMTFGPALQGEVTQKFVTSGADGSGTTMIAVNGTVYEVPRLFYNEVQVGTFVRFDGLDWTVTSKP